MERENIACRVNLANQLFLNGKINDAIKEYRYALSLKPRDLIIIENMALALLGKVLLKEEKLESAIESYEKALSINHELEDTKKILSGLYAFMGERLQNERNLKEASKFYEKGLALDCENIPLYDRLLGIKLILSDYVGAYSLYEKCKKNCSSINLDKYPNLSHFKKRH